MADSPWSADWERLVRSRVADLGFETLESFVIARAGRTFGQLAKELGPPVAHMQVQALFLADSTKAGAFRDAAAECLARTILEEFPRGWGRGARIDYRKAGVISHWVSDMLHRVEQSEIDEETLRAIAFALRDEVAPPEGWTPESGLDEHIRRAFEIGMAG